MFPFGVTGSSMNGPGKSLDAMEGPAPPCLVEEVKHDMPHKRHTICHRCLVLLIF
jgi:hypothetical protein